MSPADHTSGRTPPLCSRADLHADQAPQPGSQRMAARLKQLAEQVAESYCAFAVGPVPDEPKAFAAHHTACKAALAHLELLTRLSRAIAPDHGVEQQPLVLIADARRALVSVAGDLELTAEQVDALDELRSVAGDRVEGFGLGDQG
jgi:hypothetical protein